MTMTMPILQGFGQRKLPACRQSSTNNNRDRRIFQPPCSTNLAAKKNRCATTISMPAQRFKRPCFGAIIVITHTSTTWPVYCLKPRKTVRLLHMSYIVLLPEK